MIASDKRSRFKQTYGLLQLEIRIVSYNRQDEKPFKRGNRQLQNAIIILKQTTKMTDTHQL